MVYLEEFYQSQEGNKGRSSIVHAIPEAVARGGFPGGGGGDPPDDDPYHHRPLRGFPGAVPPGAPGGGPQVIQDQMVDQAGLTVLEVWEVQAAMEVWAVPEVLVKEEILTVTPICPVLTPWAKGEALRNQCLKPTCDTLIVHSSCTESQWWAGWHQLTFTTLDQTLKKCSPPL
ncbi:hypothetical protein C8J56DRAFT_1037682 [Mycena floridula]|nr:hypothetical protein C8J56DRAFT_1037682 [Mycena floridula]